MKSRHEQPAGPGIFESICWAFAFIVLQVFGAVGVAFLVVSASHGVPQTVIDTTSALKMLKQPPYPAILIGCGAVVPVLLGVPAILLRIGSEWRRELRLNTPPRDLMVLCLGATIPLTIVVAAVRSRAGFVVEQLGLTGGQSLQNGLPAMIEQFEGLPFLLLVSVVALGPAVIEEFLFRGLIGRGLVARWGLVPGVLLTTLLFAAVHFSPSYAIAVIPLGLFLHFVYLTTGSLKAAIGLHFSNNLFAAAAMRFGLLNDVQVELPLVLISMGTVLAIAGLLWQHRVGCEELQSYTPRTQAVAGTAVSGFTILFLTAAL